MKVMRKIIEIDEELCDGCGQCVPACAEGAIEVIDGKARLVAEKYCDGLGACLGECPTGALRVIEREAEDFDEQAVEEYLREKQQAEKVAEELAAPSCPSARLQTFSPASACEQANIPTQQTPAVSALSHWPVQIHLVPPTAPFLKDAELLVVADCVPIAYQTLHQDFIKGKIVVVGCPKFDDIPQYIQKFTDIFKSANIKSVTALVMEVPCCSGLPVIIKRAMEAAGKEIPIEQVVISTRGQVLEKGSI